MTVRQFVGVTALLVGLCGSPGAELLAAQPASLGVAQLACLDSAVLAPSRLTPCTRMVAPTGLRVPSPPNSARRSAQSPGGAGEGALIGLGVGLAAGTASALLLAEGCEENESRCTVTLIVGGAALGAGIGAVVGAMSGREGDTTASRTQAIIGGGFLSSGAYFTGPATIELVNGDAFMAMAQVSMEIHPSFAVVLAGAYANPEWRLTRVPLPGSMGLSGAALWFADAALRGRLPFGAASPRAPSVFAQAGPALGYYSLSTTVGSNVFDEDVVGLAAALGVGLTMPLSHRFGIEVMAKDYVASFDSPESFEAFGLEGRTAHTLLLLASARLGL